MYPRRTFAQSGDGFHRTAFRELGSTGCKVSEVGFGAMNMRDEELVRAAIDNGINYIDTAHSYMNGENERIVGRVMRTERDKVFLTTKIKYDNSGIDPKNMPDMVATSLKRLQTDHVDLLLLHICDTREQVLREDLIRIFDDARKRGQTRFVGVSTHKNQAAVMDAAVESGFWEAVLVGYSFISPPEVKQAIERTRTAGLGIIGMKNLLKLDAHPRPPITDYPKYAIKGIKPTQALIKWVLDDNFVDTTIPGMTTFEQLADDVAVMSMPMSFGARRTLYHYGENTKGVVCGSTAGCTGCLGQCRKASRSAR
jgi:aryl-alcohol dehydrogenase-like predicted oxidoreductase